MVDDRTSMSAGRLTDISRMDCVTDLDNLAFDIPCTFPEELVRQVCLERIELVGNGKCGL